jgi:hypothetical protein
MITNLKPETLLDRAVAAALPLALCAALASCGADPGRDEDSSSSRDDGGGTAVRLSIRADDGRGRMEKATLECDQGEAEAPGLSRRDPKKLCGLARRLGSYLGREPDPRRACTQLYGGPETARISGTIEGRKVDRRFSRTDGCEIADWDRVALLLPLKAVGTDMPLPPG